MFEKGTQQILLRATVPQRLPNRPPEVGHIVRDKISQVRIFGLVPDTLHRIELRGIGRQPFPLHPTPKASGQPSSGGTMDRPTIPDQNDAPGKLSQQLAHKGLDIIGTNIVTPDVKVQTQPSTLWRDADRRDTRQAVVAAPTLLNRRFPLRCPSPTYGRLEHKAGLVQKNDVTAGFSGVFLYAASPWSASGRWRTRRVPGPDARASGSSSPSFLAHAKPPKGRSGQQSACRSPWPHALASRAGWGSRASRDLSATNPAICLAAGWSAWAWDRDAVWLSGPPYHRVDRQRAIGRWHPAKRPTIGPPRWADDRLGARSWPETSAAGVLGVFLVFSCRRISAAISYFL